MELGKSNFHETLLITIYGLLTRQEGAEPLREVIAREGCIGEFRVHHVPMGFAEGARGLRDLTQTVGVFGLDFLGFDLLGDPRVTLFGWCGLAAVHAAELAPRDRSVPTRRTLPRDPAAHGLLPALQRVHVRPQTPQQLQNLVHLSWFRCGRGIT